jgi:hypothetical protein
MVTAEGALMTNATYVLPAGETMRLILKCNNPREAASCQHLAFAYARDVGLNGLNALQVAGCAARLAEHALARGGGRLELFVSETPRPMLQLRARHHDAEDAVLPPDLLADVRLEPDDDGSTVLVMRWSLD